MMPVLNQYPTYTCTNSTLVLTMESQDICEHLYTTLMNHVYCLESEKWLKTVTAERQRETHTANMDTIKSIKRCPDLEIREYETDFGMAKLALLEMFMV